MMTVRRIVFLTLLAVSSRSLAVESEPPKDWIDPDTGHRVVRLSTEPGTASLYFHQNAYSADGKKLIVTTKDGGISTIDLESLKMTALVPGKVSILVTGHKSGDVYFIKRDAGASEAVSENERASASTVFAANISTGKIRRVASLPAGRSVASLNADETLLLGSYTQEDSGAKARNDTAKAATAAAPAPRILPAVDRRFDQPNYEAMGADGKPMTYADAKDLRLHNALLAVRAGAPRVLFTLNTQTGEMKDIYREREWLNHLQFSPTDPNLIMFCHEGTWHEVDRVWTIRTDGTGLTQIHHRTMNMEIAGHEFFAADGKMIWYDLQTPRGVDFWLGGYEVATGKRTWYHLDRNQWSVHYNVSPDGKLFAGDGGDAEMVARAPDGKWIYLFHPKPVPDVAGIKNPDSKNLIDIGTFEPERLVNLSKHDYRLEPNLTFSPDMKWIIFRSNMHGATHVYAVEIAKAKSAAR